MMAPRAMGRSISGRLLQINFLVSAAALILACVSFLLYDALSFRENLIHSLQTEAQIIGSNSVSALLFDDRDAAKNTLAALNHAPMVVSAVILKPDGSQFAAYSVDGTKAVPDTPELKSSVAESHWTRGSRILLGSRIQFQGNDVGSVYILATTSEVWQHVRRYVLIAAFVLLLSLGIALLLTTSLRRMISDPVAALAKTARLVTIEKDYSLRAPETETGDEIAVLMTSFNEMIEQVQTRDRALSASRDLLEQRVAERTAELQEANRELESFSYSVAHDLRGPLDTLGNTTYLLAHSDISRLDERARELLGILPRTTAQMSALIDDLLNLSRSKSAELHREVVDLATIARTVIEDLAEANPARHVTIEIVDKAPAIADKGLMRVVLQNLIGNAWKYTTRTPDPRMAFGTMERDGATIYFVRDNGAGFNEKLKERLFVPFQRLHSSEEFEGTGIGLATVQRIITRHAGTIWAEAEPGVGATFFFTLG